MWKWRWNFVSRLVELRGRKKGQLQIRLVRLTLCQQRNAPSFEARPNNSNLSFRQLVVAHPSSSLDTLELAKSKDHEWVV